MAPHRSFNDERTNSKTMRPLGLRHKLNLLSIGLVILTAAGIATFVVHREITTRSQDLLTTGTTTATMIAQSSEFAVYTENQDSLKRIISGLQASPDIAYVAVLSKHGDVLLEQTFGADLMLPTALRGRLPAAGHVVSEEFSIRESGTSYIDIVVPVVGRDLSPSDSLFLEAPETSTVTSVIGYIQLGLSQEALHNNLRQFMGVTGLVLCIVVGLGFVLTLTLTRSITKPIFAVVKAAGQIAEGHYDVTVTVNTNDEVHQLADAFNRMTFQLQISQEEIREYQRGLEEKVSERTSQLEAASQESRRLAIEAQAANLAKSQFLANMSHEIRTPMNGVLGMAELLLTMTMSDRQRHMVESVHRSGTALLGIINDILDFSKIEAGKLELEHIPFGLRRTIEEAVELFADQASQKGLELTCFLPNETPDTVIGDPARLRQVLLNLLGNAVKFTQRGDVSLRVHCLSLEAQRVTLKCEVHDTGIGISEEAQKRLFHVFSQADGSTTRRFGGTGLGLAIVKQLVHLMGGEVGIESVSGQGSTFWFTVKLGYDPTHQSQVTTPIQSLAGIRVLIVDDNATNRFILESQLKAWEAEPISAASATAALEQLDEAVTNGKPIDMAILDIHMPDIDGIMLSRMIKANPHFNHIPLLALSSVDQQSSTGETGGSNFFSWLRKPARQSLLRECLVRQRYALPDTRPLTKASEPKPAIIGGHLLLAEDNPVNREVAVGMLELLGYRVDIVEHGRQAVEAVSKHHYDLVLMDCQMPEMDGFAATAAIRRHEQSTGADRHVPIIALTANAMEGDREKCVAAGMDDYLSKPFSQAGMQATIQRWMEARPTDALPSRQTLSKQSVSTTSIGIPVIDDAVWENLLAMERAGRSDALHKILSLYLSDSSRLVGVIHDAIQKRNGAMLTDGAHQLKSTSAQVGAQAASFQAGEIERLARQQQLDAAADLLGPLDESVELACKIFRTKIQARAA